MFNAKVKCNYANVDLNEVLNYGTKPSVPGDVFKEGVFKKSGHHKGAGKSSYSDQIRCFRLKNHFLYYYQGDSLPIVDKNVTGVIILINVYISRGLMNAPTNTYAFFSFKFHFRKISSFTASFCSSQYSFCSFRKIFIVFSQVLFHASLSLP